MPWQSRAPAPARYARGKGRRCLRRHWDAAGNILDWARDYGDTDGDGYLEYQTRSSKGTKNQGWKDSGDAIIYEDGSAVAAPIATCELLGYGSASRRIQRERTRRRTWSQS